MTAMQGSLFWMAPEMLHNDKKGYNAKIDIWSLGCVFIEMFAGRRPWEQDDFVSVMFKVGCVVFTREAHSDTKRAFRLAAIKWHHQSRATFICPRKETTSVSNASPRIRTNGPQRKASKTTLGSTSHLDGSSQVSIETHLYDINLSSDLSSHRLHIYFHSPRIFTKPLLYVLSLII